MLGISKQTLLRYEKKGAIPCSSRNNSNRWREYTTADIKKLSRILGRGFTLIEMIMVIIIISVLSVIAIPRLQSFGVFKLHSAVKRAVADIRYAQQLAISQHNTFRINFNTTSNSYEVRRVSDNQLAVHPATRAAFLINLSTDPQLSGVRIVSPSFGGTAGVQYNWRGVPANTNNVTLAQEGSVRFSYGPDDIDIYIRPNTGTLRVVQ
jgi:prepilin-type N-terminal cleavage/methylation domain-containing protein